MKKLILASTAAIAMFGLAACSDTDETTTQSVDEPAATTLIEPTDDTAATPAPADEPPADAESVAPEAPEAPAQ
jgi:uncharacterized protein YgiB involved in biofilm formation